MGKAEQLRKAAQERDEANARRWQLESRVQVLEEALEKIQRLTGADQWGDAIDRVAQAALPASPPSGEPKHLGTFTQEWCKWAAELEDGHEVAAGRAHPEAQPPAEVRTEAKRCHECTGPVDSTGAAQPAQGVAGECPECSLNPETGESDCEDCYARWLDTQPDPDPDPDTKQSVAGKKPCFTCGKSGCKPMNHAGWDPSDKERS